MSNWERRPLRLS
jgi:hypothetical protein